MCRLTTEELRPGSDATLFVFGGAGGATDELASVVDGLTGDPRVVAIALAAEPGAADTIESMAAESVGAIRAEQPHGPYRLLGYSFGGLLALEAARLLDRCRRDRDIRRTRGLSLRPAALADRALRQGNRAPGRAARPGPGAASRRGKRCGSCPGGRLAWRRGCVAASGPRTRDTAGIASVQDAQPCGHGAVATLGSSSARSRCSQPRSRTSGATWQTCGDRGCRSSRFVGSGATIST